MPARVAPAALLRLLLAVIGLVVLAGCGADDTVYDLRDGASAAGEADYHYLIPEGTGARLDAGEGVEIMPNWLLVDVGETIEIVNEDERGHLVGPYFIGPGETMRQRFSSAGKLEGVCTVHPSGQITVIIQDV